jgi:hypothetical protein
MARNMNTPPRLKGESARAYEGFRAYVELDGHPSKVAKKLACSRQNVDKWVSKWHWKDRLAAARQRECEEKIAAEAKATEIAATISETEKSNAWRRAFELAECFIKHAMTLHATDPSGAATLARVAFTILESVKGGAARGYSVGVNLNNVVAQYPSVMLDDAGKPIEQVDFIRSYQEAVALLERGETPEWNEHSIDATPMPENGTGEATTSDSDARLIGKSTPSAMDCKSTEAEVEPLSTRHRVPARMTESEIPTSEGATLPSHKMFDNVECINAARRTAGDP